MQMTLCKFDSKQQKALIFVVAVIVITVMLGKKMWRSQEAKLAVIKGKIENYQKMTDLSYEIKTLRQEVEKFKDVVWLTQDSASVMDEINRLATRYNIEILNFDPGSLVDRGNYFTLSLNLRIRAEYFNLVKFASGIENLKTLTKIVSLRLSPEVSSTPQESGPLINANLSFEAYVFKEMK